MRGMRVEVERARVARVQPRQLYPVAVVPRRRRRRWRPERTARLVARLAFYLGTLVASWSTVFAVGVALFGPPGAIWHWFAAACGGGLAAALGARWDEHLDLGGERDGR